MSTFDPTSSVATNGYVAIDQNRPRDDASSSDDDDHHAGKASPTDLSPNIARNIHLTVHSTFTAVTITIYKLQRLILCPAYKLKNDTSRCD